MNNKLSNNFSLPTRQSYIAILLILFNIYKRFIKTFWYLLVPLFLGKRSNSSYYLYIILAIALILAIYAIIDFYRYRFYLKDKEFIVEKGVFSKKRIVIPFDRIQSINFKQNIIHQVFDVVSLEIDTAGTSKKEFDFHALDIGRSNELRTYIFAHKNETYSSTSEWSEDIDQTIGNENNLGHNNVRAIEIFSLKLGDLIKIGLTQNHFRSLFFGLLSIFWLLDQVEKLGIDISMLEEFSEEDVLQLGFYLLGSLLLLAIIVVIIVSIIRTFLRYYNLRMLRVSGGFKLDYGLFNRNEISVMDNKMQVMIWSDNLLRKILGLFTLHIKLASSVQVKSKKSIVIPGATLTDISQIRNYYYPNKISEMEHFESSDPYYLLRRISISILIFGIISGLLYYFEDSPLWMIPIGLLGYFILTSFLKFSKMKYGFNSEAIQLNTGIFGNKYSLLTLYKLQGVSLKQSFVQHRKGLADIVLYSAAGNHRVRYIDKKKAELLRDYILYRIESDHRDWM